MAENNVELKELGLTQLSVSAADISYYSPRDTSSRLCSALDRRWCTFRRRLGCIRWRVLSQGLAHYISGTFGTLSVWRRPQMALARCCRPEVAPEKIYHHKLSADIKVIPDPEGRCTTQYSTRGSIWASRVGFNSTKLFWIPLQWTGPNVLVSELYHSKVDIRKHFFKKTLKKAF